MSLYGSTRIYNPGITMYKNMDIENMMNKNMNFSNPAIRVAKQMEVIRNFRNSMKNGDT